MTGRVLSSLVKTRPDDSWVDIVVIYCMYIFTVIGFYTCSCVAVDQLVLAVRGQAGVPTRAAIVRR